jgi:hypothetical protein
MSQIKITRPSFAGDLRDLRPDEFDGVNGGLSVATDAALKTNVSFRRLRVGDPADPNQVAGALHN